MLSESQTGPESSYAWLRLVVALLLCTLGGVGMWSVVVTLPIVQAEFGVARGDASLPYTLTMIGFGIGGVFMGQLADRRGVMPAVMLGTVALAAGFWAASFSANLGQFALVQGVLIGVGSSATFAPLLADTSHWFIRRRGMAVAIIASGNYLAGALWPPVLQYAIAETGWRSAYVSVALFCLATMTPLALVLKRRAPMHAPAAATAGSLAAGNAQRALGLSAPALQVLLLLAGFACCVAMSMPQVHIVAYCGDLGYGAARGASMLSLMLGCGVVSRLSFGWISDRIGGLRTLLLGSTLQGVALLMFLPVKGLVPLYVVAGLFGLFQGGIVPAYALIVREYFPAGVAATRVGAVMTSTLFGMALGGWMSGAIFDLTGSYRAAFINGIAWNALNLTIALFLAKRLLWRPVPV